MKRSELKSGMLVVLSNGNRSIVMNDTPSGDVLTTGVLPENEQGVTTTWCPLSKYDDDLTYINDDECDIVEVYGYSSNMQATSLSKSNRTLLWKRDGGAIELRLTKDYMAFIDLKNKVIIVGCQTIPFDKVEELHKIMHKEK
jgi:hypothetical protein